MANEHGIIQYAFHSTSGIAKDDIVNVWHYRDSAGITGPVLNSVINHLSTFYDSVFRNTGPTDSLLGHTMSGTWTAKGYRFEDTPPRVPITTVNSGTPMYVSASSDPREVALCASFHAAYVSGEPPARKKGRVYLGPFKAGLTSADGTVDSGVVSSVATAAETLITAIDDGSHQTCLCVYSPTDGQWNAIVGGWVDNAWDTQRRRGQVATSRTTWTA